VDGTKAGFIIEISLRSAPLPELTERGCVPETRSRHIAHLKKLRKFIEDNAGTRDRPLAEVAVAWMHNLKKEKAWTAATQERNMSGLAGALQRLNQYADTQKGIALNDSSVWKDAMRAARHGAQEESARVPPPITEEEVLTVVRQQKTACPQVAKLLALAWPVAGRIGDVLQLKEHDLVRDPRDPTTVVFAFKRGKGVMARGPYSVSTVVHPELLKLFPPAHPAGTRDSPTLFNFATKQDREKLYSNLRDACEPSIPNSSRGRSDVGVCNDWPKLGRKRRFCRSSLATRTRRPQTATWVTGFSTRASATRCCERREMRHHDER
jgi:hypothetical protein